VQKFLGSVYLMARSG